MSGDDNTDESQKTEDPTPKKLEDARKDGKTIQSKEVNNWVVLFAITLIIMIGAPSMMSELKTIFQSFLEQAHEIPTDKNGLGIVLRELIISIFKVLALPLGVLAVAGALSGFIQTGAVFSTKPLSMDISKISLAKGIGRLFSMRSVVELLKGVFKLLLVTVAGIFVLMPYFDNVEHFVGIEITQAMFEMHTLLLKIMISTLSVLFFLAVADYMYQRHEFMKEMRMSKEEIKEEYKQSEGDPQIKGKLRQIREEKARQRMMQSVPEADVVITNPTHYAVALKYNSLEMDAPTMVAKGVDKVAERIKEVAKENNVPIVENAAVARALHSSMEIDQTIPQEHFKAVAEIISYVFKLKGRKS